MHLHPLFFGNLPPWPRVNPSREPLVEKAMAEKSENYPNARQTLRPGDVAPPGTAGTGEAPCRICRGSGINNGRRCEECAGTGIVIQGIGGG